MNSSKAVAFGALMLVIGGGSVNVNRLERSFKTMLTNFGEIAEAVGDPSGLDWLG